MIHGVRIKDGKATYVSRFVKTSRLQQEEFFGDAKLMKIGDLKGFFGLVMVIMQQLRIKLKVLDDSYGNGTANTSLIYHHGKLLALQETDKPYVIKVLEDGDLQTLGMTEYDKRLTHSFTAHPKVDPVTGKSSIFPEKHDIVFLLTHDVPYLFTGEMFTFGCSPMPPYLTYRVISKDGIMHDPVPITISKPIMMHDFAITENYAIFMDLPMHFRPKEMVKEKKMIYSFDPTKKARFGIQVYIGLRAALSCEWIRQLFVWVTLELRFMTLVSDIPMVLVLFGPTLATSNSIFIALARSSAVCSSLTGSIPGIGVMFVYLSSWWQVEEKLIFIFSLMNMDVAGYDFSLVPRLNQSSFLILPPIWSELEEQASLVLQGSSSHRMLFSAYGAVCVVLRVTLDAIFEVAYDVFVIRSHMFAFFLDGIPRVKGIIKFDLHAEAETGKTKLRVGGNIKGIYEMGQGTYGSDAIYVSGATAEEDDGYLIFYAHDENTGKSCVNVIDAKTMSSEPVAVVELPHRVPYGFHALFVTEEQLQEQTLI
uniref:Carotenoid cleavage dioxygenase 1 n=2 Tax=Brassica oleracea var. oleracea TaxID=109376 RepID=A0A0D3DVJ8_BRAOL